MDYLLTDYEACTGTYFPKSTVLPIIARRLAYRPDKELINIVK